MSVEVGAFVNNANPMTRRENWSMTTATHQQNGQHWSFENGIHGTQKPAAVGTTVRSMCQMWFGRLALIESLETVVDSSIVSASSAGSSESGCCLQHPSHGRCPEMQPSPCEHLSDLFLAHRRAHGLEPTDEVANVVGELVHGLGCLDEGSARLPRRCA